MRRGGKPRDAPPAPAPPASKADQVAHTVVSLTHLPRTRPHPAQLSLPGRAASASVAVASSAIVSALARSSSSWQLLKGAASPGPVTRAVKAAQISPSVSASRTTSASD
jgi:hypothetical protein